MRFSIIIPVYNVELYLSDCLDSILNQNFDNYEVIIVNDGSTDRSYDIILAYQNRFNNLVVLDQKNKGVSAARNLGLSVATGDYIWFVDSDDKIAEGALSLLSAKITDNQCDILSFSSQHLIDATKEIRQNTIFDDSVYESCINFLRDNKLEIAPWIYVIKRQVLTSNQILFREDVKLHEDEFYVLDIFAFANKIITIKAGLYIYRIRPNSLMRSNRICDKLYALSELIVYCQALYGVKYCTSFWDDRLYGLLNNFYRTYNLCLKNRDCPSIDDQKLALIRSIKLNSTTADVWGVKIMKWLHNNLFFIYRFRIVK